MSKRSSDYSGWMFKEGKRVKNWKQRWFELRGDKLHYYEQKNGDKPIFTIILTKQAELEVLHDDDAPHDNMFLLQTQDRDWKFSVDCRNERDAWMTHLRNNLPTYTRRSTAMSTTTTSRDALIEGYLEKTGKWNTNWKKRWCKLYPKEKKLRYYIVSENKKTFKDKINLDKVTAIARVNSKGRPHGFVLVTRGRRYKFAADTVEDLEIWLKAIGQLVGCKQESSLRDKQGLLQTLLTLNHFPMGESKRGNIFLPDWLWHEVSDMMGNIEAPQTEDQKGDVKDDCSEGFICRPGLIVHLLQDTTTLSFDAAMKLLEDSRQSFLLKPLLIDVQGPIYIIGQLNGDFDGLINIFETLGTPPETRYLFLGNIIGSGMQSLGVALLLLAMKVHYPEHLYIIRGKMEDQIQSRAPKGSLYDECKKQFGTEDGRELWKEFVWLFDHMPICAVLNGTLFAVASGLSQNIIKVASLRTGKIRPLYIARTNAKKYPPGRLIGSVIVRDFLWNIPVDGRISWKKQSNGSDKGLVYYQFGKSVLNNFLNQNRFTKMIRTGPVNMTDAVFRLGHTTFAENRLISISSSANYNSALINNKVVKGAVMFLEETGEDFTFHTFKADC